MKNYLGILALFAGMGCGQAQRQEVLLYGSPTGYDLNNPEVFEMADALGEISGITFLNGDPDMVFAQQDEEGILFFFALGDKEPKQVKFGKDGDYEDIGIYRQDVVVLRSDGSLYRFPVAERHRKQIRSVAVSKKPFPDGEYESLATRMGDSLSYVLCKNCKVDRKLPVTTGHAFRLNGDGTVDVRSSFSISHAQIEQFVPPMGQSFQPSAMAWNPFSNEWYVLSSINKLLVILDENWQVIQAYQLDATRYTQPEGLAFDCNRALYISNERGRTGKRATIFKFPFKG